MTRSAERCRRCEMAQTLGFVIFGLWLAGVALTWQGDDLSRLGLWCCSALSLLAALRHQVAAVVAALRGRD